MEDSIEIIEFFRPSENFKNLYLTNLPPSDDVEPLGEGDGLHELLLEKFSRYGLIYEIQVFVSSLNSSSRLKSNEKDTSKQSDSSSCYAFVKFYSARAAQAAKQDLSGRFILKSQLIMIKYATRAVSEPEPPVLYVAKCYELASFYLGFNGFSTKSLLFEKEASSDADEITYKAIIQLDLLHHGLTCYGLGRSSGKFNPEDLANKGVVLGVVKKQAHQRAIEDAFSKVLLLVLPGGKVHAEVNTTLEERLGLEVNENQIIKVNELEGEEAGDDSGDDVTLDFIFGDE